MSRIQFRHFSSSFAMIRIFWKSQKTSKDKGSSAMPTGCQTSKYDCSTGAAASFSKKRVGGVIQFTLLIIIRNYDEGKKKSKGAGLRWLH